MYFFSLFIIDAAGQEKTDAVKTTDTASLRLSDEIFLFADSAAVPVGGFDAVLQLFINESPIS